MSTPRSVAFYVMGALVLDPVSTLPLDFLRGLLILAQEAVDGVQGGWDISGSGYQSWLSCVPPGGQVTSSLRFSWVTRR